MDNTLHLVWNNPCPQPHRKSDVKMLRNLADVMAGTIRAGQFESARYMASVYRLSPLALSVVATRMFRDGISEDEILRVV